MPPANATLVIEGKRYCSTCASHHAIEKFSVNPKTSQFYTACDKRRQAASARAKRKRAGGWTRSSGPGPSGGGGRQKDPKAESLAFGVNGGGEYIPVHGAIQLKVNVEICVDSVESAQTAVANGANRLELCSSVAVGGGTTPSIGLYKEVLRAVDVPIMIMIRCRLGPFVYSLSELDVMFSDAEAFCVIPTAPGRLAGFVFGALMPDGKVDEAALERMLNLTIPNQMSFTFHRAFDMIPDAREGFATLNKHGVTRILTSGGVPSLASPSATYILADLAFRHNPDGTTIMPGAGLNPTRLPFILDALKPAWLARAQKHALNWPQPFVIGEVHLSASAFVLPRISDEGFVRPDVRKAGMGFGVPMSVAGDAEAADWGRWVVIGSRVKEIRDWVDIWAKNREAEFHSGGSVNGAVGGMAPPAASTSQSIEAAPDVTNENSTFW